ncbi:hypothetical protein AX17_001604 [Amanita inopinata Kibby_2008]|nr:hypothetical protein AX17_001604 [Amanita inopinata Kibby_2008]
MSSSPTPATTPSPSGSSAVSLPESTSTVRVSSSLNPSSPSGSSSPTQPTPQTLSPPTLLRPRGHSVSTPRGHDLPASVSHPLSRVTSLSATPTHKSSLSLPAEIGEPYSSSHRSRSRSPLRQFDDAISKLKEDETHTPSNKSLSRWWNKDERIRRNVIQQEPIPGWQETEHRVARAAASVLGPTLGVAHAILSTGIDLLEFVPLPGLAPVARTLLQIWDALDAVDMNRTACLRLTERCADILLSVREEIQDAGDIVGEDLAAPIAKLIESFSLVYSLLQKLNHRPFLKRYLKRDEILRQISECDKALTDALGMFSLSIQIRILRQVQAYEMQRQSDTREILNTIISVNPTSNALLLSGVHVKEERISTTIPSPSPAPVSSLPAHASGELPPAVLPMAQGPMLAVNDVPNLAMSPSRVLPTLRELHTRQNTLDAAKDMADLRRLMGVAVHTSNDAQMLEVLQVGRDEMPEAIKTLQRALEKIVEHEASSGVSGTGPASTQMPEPAPLPAMDNGKTGFLARRMTLRSFKGKEVTTLKRSKTDSSTTSKGTNGASSKSSDTGRARDTLDREFIESGLDALRRMSQGIEKSLPSWTITRYEIDREEKIGRGFFSDVYKGKWRGRTVAIKVLLDTTPRKLFINEIEIWKSLHHPNVLELYGASSATSDPPWFFVSPYAKHGSLPEYLRHLVLDVGVLAPTLGSSGSLGHGNRSPFSSRRPSPVRDSLLKSSLSASLPGHGERPLSVTDVPNEWNLYRFMHEIARGMEYLHSVKVVRGDVEVRGILHGDLKAANILVDDRFHCVISDFGQSEMKSEAYRLSGMPLPHGTLRWQAPELMAGAADLTPAMDVYSFSICCIEVLLMGRIPWSFHDDNDVRRFVLDEDRRPSFPDVPQFNSPSLRDLIQACWDRNPAKRPAFTKIVQEMKILRKKAGQNPDEAHTPQKQDISKDERAPRPSPDMKPVPLPPVLSRSSEEVGVNLGHKSPSYTHAEDTVASECTHGHEHVIYVSSEPSSRASSLFTHTASSEESFLFTDHAGYESPMPHDDNLLERKHEMRYRMLLNHDFHPSLTLALWSPSLIKLGAVGYLSKPGGRFITLFNSFTPDKSPIEATKNIPSLFGYGKVVCGSQRQDKRNMALRGLDIIAGLLTFRNTESRSISRRYSFPLRSGHKTAQLCTETTIYRYMESLDVPKKWFKANVDHILDIYAPDHPITKEDLYLVIGTLNTPDYALFVSHKHPDGQAHFNVYAAPRNDQAWGTFTTDNHVSPKLGGPVYDESISITPSSASHISSVGDGWSSVLLARLRFKPDITEPTSL